MSVSIFCDKSQMPGSDMIEAALVDTYSLWAGLTGHVKEAYPSVTEDWKHYGKASGWVLKLLSKKRNLLFLIPLNGCFRVCLVLGEKAVVCAENSGLPNEITEAIRSATPYAEGRSVYIDIKCTEQLDVVKSLLKIKFEN